MQAGKRGDGGKWNEIANKFWCTNSFNCSIVLRSAENSIRMALQRGSASTASSNVSLSHSFFRFRRYYTRDWEIDNCVHKSDLLVAIDGDSKTMYFVAVSFIQSLLPLFGFPARFIPSSLQHLLFQLVSAIWTEMRYPTQIPRIRFRVGSAISNRDSGKC